MFYSANNFVNNNKTNVDPDLKSGIFWRKGLNPVPGRPSPCNKLRINVHKDVLTSFEDFQESVSDAWDMTDDIFCSITNTDSLIPTAALGDPNNNENKLSDNISQRDSISKHLPKQVNTIKTSFYLKKNAQPTKSFKFSSRIFQYDKFLKPDLTVPSSENELSKIVKFRVELDKPLLNLDNLRKLSWSGIPKKLRPNSWRLLAGYSPISLERRQHALHRKRLDYWNLVKQYYAIREEDEIYQEIYQQIHIDIPRMSQITPLFQQEIVWEIFERILFIWAVRHPASGYVQGMNDLVTPFFVVFLEECVYGQDLTTVIVSSLPNEKRENIEADSFWCLSRFLDGIQDNYIFAHLGIQQKINQLKELVQRIDSKLHEHLQQNHIEYLQFSFRWMNNLLTRELPLSCSIRLWDTYLAESDFSSLHKYVCVAFLRQWREQLLLEKDFQGLMLTLQNLPTKNWTFKEVEMLVAEAYRLKYLFSDAPKHLQFIGNESS